MMDLQAAQPPYDRQLAREVAAGTARSRRAALELLERNDPPTLSAAIELVWPGGSAPPERVHPLALAWDLYRHVRDMPCA
jgi:hypothetical protein